MPEEVFETSQPTQPIESKSTNWPKMVLVAVLGLGLLVGAAYAGYWYGMKKKTESMPEVVAPEARKLFRNSAATNPYGFSYPKSWSVSHEHEEATVSGEVRDRDVVTISKDDYRIVISQTGEKVRFCLFPGNPRLDEKDAHYTYYSGYKDVDVDSEDLRRVWPAGIGPYSYEFCYKIANGWVTAYYPFGGIFYQTPREPDQAILSTMDSVVESLEEVKVVEYELHESP